jgi:hypothetical protein
MADAVNIPNKAETRVMRRVFMLSTSLLSEGAML